MKQARRHGLRGASLIEFAIAMPVAVLLVLALIQAGFLYMAKLTLNHAVFMAARGGSLNHANTEVIRDDLIRGLSPFYQDSTISSDTQRLWDAYLRAQADAGASLQITELNPSDESFADFGVRDPIRQVTYIPNDNLEWRSDAVGMRSGQNLRDANLLKLRVVYGYELKVPLMARVLRWALCGVAPALPTSTHCARHYERGRVPIEAFAIIEMQSRAERPTGVAGGSVAGRSGPPASAASTAGALGGQPAQGGFNGSTGRPVAAGATPASPAVPGDPAAGIGAGPAAATARVSPPHATAPCDGANASECQPSACLPADPACASTPTCDSG